jgi:hypothetical protein
VCIAVLRTSDTLKAMQAAASAHEMLKSLMPQQHPVKVQSQAAAHA